MSKESFTSAEFYRYLGRNEFMATRSNACQKFFAGGADINELLELNRETGETWIRVWHEVFAKIHYSSRIVIAAINGFALGGGVSWPWRVT